MTPTELKLLLTAWREDQLPEDEVIVIPGTRRVPTATLRQSLVALANRDAGGLILIGIRAQGRRALKPVGLVDKKVEQFRSLLETLGAELVPPVAPVQERLVLPGGVVLAARVAGAPRSQRPVHARDAGPLSGSFVRQGGRDRMLSAAEVELYRAAATGQDQDRGAVAGAGLGDLDPSLVDALSDSASGPLAGLSSEDLLLARGAAVRQGDTLVPTIAGLLALGRFPQQFLPGCALELKVPAAASEEDEEPPLRVEQVIEGNISQSLAQLRDFVAGRLVNVDAEQARAWITIVESLVRNALLHRSYAPAARRLPIAVEFLPGSIEVVSPGPIPSAVDPDELGLGEGVRAPANPALYRIAQMLSLTPAEESDLEGACAWIRELGLEPPLIAEEGAFVRMGLYFDPLFGLDEEEEDEPEETPDWLRQLTPRTALEEPERVALGLAWSRGSLSVGDLARSLALPLGESRQLLDHLSSRQLLRSLSLVAGRAYGLGSGEPASSRPRRPRGQAAADAMVDALRTSPTPLTRKDLEDVTGLATSTIRVWLRRLIKQGRIAATAEATSKRRAYTAAD